MATLSKTSIKAREIIRECFKKQEQAQKDIINSKCDGKHESIKDILACNDCSNTLDTM